MGHFRIPYGSSFGTQGTLGPTSAKYLITPGDTTPDVTNGTFFVTANTSATTIVYFDTYAAGGSADLTDVGRKICIWFGDANTTIQNGTNIYLSDTQGTLPTGSVLELMKVGTGWYETNRSTADQTPQNPLTRRAVNFTWAGTAALINVTTANYVLLTATGLLSTVHGFVGGVSGQEIAVQLVGVGSTVAFVQSAGILSLAGTNAFYISNTAVYRFFTAYGTEWASQAGLVSP